MSSNQAVDVSFERELLDTVGRLYFTPADRVAARSALLRLQGRISEAPPVAYKHKVTTIMAANARELSSDGDPKVAEIAGQLAAVLQSDDADALAHRRLLRREVGRISSLLGNRGCIIKGFCNARFYPANYDRWMRDIDVFCPSWADALSLLEVLLADGYEFDLDECSWVKADETRGRDMYGQLFLIRPYEGDFSRIDLHFGTYSIGYAGYLAMPAQGIMVPFGLDDATVNVLDARLCPLIAQSHALSDGYVAMKDVNDFVAMATSADLDWKAVGVVLREHQLHPQAALLAKHVLRLYDHPPVVSAAEALLKGTGSPRISIWQTHNRSWRLRAFVNTSFAARWSLKRGRGPIASALDAARCFLFYIRRLQLSVRTRSPIERLLRAVMAEPKLDQWKLRPDACTLLIDAGVAANAAGLDIAAGAVSPRWTPTPVPAIAVSHVDATTLVQMDRRVFVPTLDLILPPEDAKVASGV